MLITTKTHKAIVADKDAEIADLQYRRLNAKRFLDEGREREETLRKQVYALEDENMALRARLEAADKIADALHVKLWEADQRLAPFERTRGKGGRFVKKEDGL